KLTVGGGPYTLYEVNANDGAGFFAANNITVTTTGSSYVNSVTSSQDVGGTITLGNSLSTAGFGSTLDSSGTVMALRNGVAKSFNWTSGTTTVQNVLDFLNTTMG